LATITPVSDKALPQDCAEEVPRQMFADILALIARLRALPAPA